MRDVDWYAAAHDQAGPSQRDLLQYLYDWVAPLPVKHPQQAELREQVRELLGIT